MRDVREIALFCIALAIALLFISMLSDWATDRGIFDYHQQPNNKTYRAIDTICKGLDETIFKQSSRRTDPKPQTITEPDKQAYDSCQQWRAAEASEKSAYFAEWQGIGAHASVVIAFFTFIAACFAAYWAMMAARHTENAVGSARQQVIAAQSALAHSEDTARRQLRSYFAINAGHIQAEHVEGSAWKLNWSVEVKNCGQTPAYRVETRSDSKVYSKIDSERPTLTPEAQIEPRRSITGAGSSIHVQGHQSVSKLVIDGIERGSWDLIIKGRVDYVDIFDQGRWFEFNCQRGERAGAALWSIGPSPAGEDGN